MRVPLTIGLLAALCGCSAASRTQNDTGATAPSLAGRWSGSSAGLSVSLTLEQTADSVTGTGTFTTSPNSSMGCGGETLPASGPVTMSGKLTGSDLQARVTFAGTWSPPYAGTLAAKDSIAGHFMSIDRGGCPLSLVRER
ncbi:MAG TPA: hypothetical protein VII02_13305 [Gemmatimonadaceae bacterium]